VEKDQGRKEKEKAQEPQRNNQRSFEAGSFWRLLKLLLIIAYIKPKSY
jgi:hypothetical protein